MATDLFRDVLDDPTTLQNAAGATGNGTSLDVRGYPTAVVQVTGATPAGTITFEGTVDGTNFVSVEAINVATGVASPTTTAVGVFLLPVAGLERIRARISVFTSGTWTVVGRGILADTASVALTTAGGGGGTVTANQGTAGASPWPVSDQATTGTLTDRSGTITVGAAAQTLAASNASRKYFFLQNNGSAVLWVNFTTTAVQAQPSIQLAPGASLTFSGPYITTELVSIIGPTTGQTFTAKEG